jgi:hypothetical protein
MRLFVLVAAFILVLIVAEKARDPKSWQWFFALDERPVPQRIDNRLPPQPHATSDEVIVVAQNSSPAVNAEQAKSPAIGPQARAWSEGIKALWNPLASDRRTLLYRLLQCSQDQEIWPGTEQGAADEVIAELSQSWTEYQRLAKESVAELAAEEQFAGALF